MADNTHRVRLKSPSSSIQNVVAASAEVYGKHLVMLDAKGQVVA
jgi:hypothetical protein